MSYINTTPTPDKVWTWSNHIFDMLWDKHPVGDWFISDLFLGSPQLGQIILVKEFNIDQMHTLRLKVDECLTGREMLLKCVWFSPAPTSMDWGVPVATGKAKARFEVVSKTM